MSKWLAVVEQFGQLVNPTGLPRANLTNSAFATGLRLVFGIAGGIALIIISIAGFKYVLSQGNPQETAKAKNTILYALIGLALSISAYAIVSYVAVRI